LKLETNEGKIQQRQSLGPKVLSITLTTIIRLQMENAIFNLNTNCKFINSSVQKKMNSMGVPKHERL